MTLLEEIVGKLREAWTLWELEDISRQYKERTSKLPEEDRQYLNDLYMNREDMISESCLNDLMPKKEVKDV